MVLPGSSLTAPSLSHYEHLQTDNISKQKRIHQLEQEIEQLRINLNELSEDLEQRSNIWCNKAFSEDFPQ